MKLRLWAVALALFGWQVHAQSKVRIDVAALSNLTSENPCNVASWWGEPLLEAMRRHLQVSLSQNPSIDVVEAVRLRTYRPSLDSQVEVIPKERTRKNSHFSVQGSVQRFNFCQTTDTTQTRFEADVAIQIQILNTKDGSTVDSFLAESKAEEVAVGDRTDYRGAVLGSGVFKESPVGKAMMIALSNASAGIAQRLPASVLPSDMKVKTFRAGKIP